MKNSSPNRPLLVLLAIFSLSTAAIFRADAQYCDPGYSYGGPQYHYDCGPIFQPPVYYGNDPCESFSILPFYSNGCETHYPDHFDTLSLFDDRCLPSECETQPRCDCPNCAPDLSLKLEKQEEVPFFYKKGKIEEECTLAEPKVSKIPQVKVAPPSYFDEKGGGNCTCSKAGTCESCRRKDAAAIRDLPRDTKPSYSQDPKNFYHQRNSRAREAAPPAINQNNDTIEKAPPSAGNGNGNGLGRFPIDTAVRASNGGTTTVGRIMTQTGARAILINFWASWCGPCVASMPELKNRATELSPRGILVAGMNIEADMEKAARMKERQTINFPWLIEPASKPFSRQFKINSVPRALLVDRDGNVLFNGHPSDRNLSSILARLGNGSTAENAKFVRTSY